jgi:hypothetical protein
MYILTEYLDQAMAQAVYEKLDDGKYGGRIPTCPGVVAFAASLGECSEDPTATTTTAELPSSHLPHHWVSVPRIYALPWRIGYFWG